MSHLHFKLKQAKVLFYQQLTLFYPFEKVTKQVGKIPLSNNTVKRIMDEISKNKKRAADFCSQQSGIYSLQLYKITDIAGNTNSSIKDFLKLQ